VVETDTFNLIIASVLSQYDNKDILHLVTYFSKKHSPAEINYEINDKELLVCIYAFKEWYLLLEGFPCPIEVISDH
jgi:hypothetical protein